MRLLTRLKWLHAFEATARHGSLTGAAEELGVTPAAVGQLVRALEEWVGQPLLHRIRSGKERLILVNEARSALQDISLGLDYLESGLNKLHTKKIRPILAVSVTKVLLVNWLMDKLKLFDVQFPEIDLQLNINEQKPEPLRAEADVSIRFGSGDWAGLNKTWLSDEEVWLVCSPLLLVKDENNTNEWFAEQTLLEDESLD
jgi:LysR family transcriptional regulator, glycine cleavage system transcriptional activator